MVNHLVNWLSPFKERVTVVTGDRGACVADTISADLTFHANGPVPDAVGHDGRVPWGRRGRHHPYAIAKREPLLVELERLP